jgi:hypothetical protein
MNDRHGLRVSRFEVCGCCSCRCCVAVGWRLLFSASGKNQILTEASEASEATEAPQNFDVS